MDDIDGALLFQAVDMCYFSGTAQDGLVYIPRDGEPIIMMKRSLVRAKEESPLEVRPLKNMRNLKEDLGIKTSATIGLEMDVLPCSFYFRVNKALEDASFVDVAERIKHIRSVKSEFEIKLATFIGVKHLITVNSGSSANLVAFSTLTSPRLGERAIQQADVAIGGDEGDLLALQPGLAYQVAFRAQ